jgi:diadenosine tetraphosphate (Ap4A) HIT family hydrolase
LFCVGKFYPEIEVDSMSLDYSVENSKYITGETEIKIPTYFIDCSPSNEMSASLDGREICKNLTFLGRRGIRSIKGLNVAYLGGNYDPYLYQSNSISSPMNYSKKDFITLQEESKKYDHVDLFLSCDWGKGILNHLSSNDLPKKQPISQSPVISQLSEILKPKYHFSGNEGFYFERIPYSNENTNSTRFISMGKVNSEEKYLFAFSFSFENFNEPKVKTHSPFKVVESNSQVVMNKNNNVKSNVQKNQYKKKKMENKSNINCWFCLSNPDVEKHLLVSIQEESYLAFPKGGLTNDHILLISMAHTDCYMNLSDDSMKEIEKYLENIKKFYSSKNKSIIIYERNIYLNKVPNHFHFQIIPISNELLKESEDIFQKEFDELNLNYTIYDSSVNVKDLIFDSNCHDSEYFLVLLPNGNRIIHKITNKSGKLIFNFGRETCAKLLKEPEKKDWKVCAVSKEEETKMVLSFRKEFQTFDL